MWSNSVIQRKRGVVWPRSERPNQHLVALRPGQKVELMNGTTDEVERYLGHDQYVLKNHKGVIFDGSRLKLVGANTNRRKR